MRSPSSSKQGLSVPIMPLTYHMLCMDVLWLFLLMQAAAVSLGMKASSALLALSLVGPVMVGPPPRSHARH